MGTQVSIPASGNDVGSVCDNSTPQASSYSSNSRCVTSNLRRLMRWVDRSEHFCFGVLVGAAGVLVLLSIVSVIQMLVSE